MSVRKRGDSYQADFTVKGVRYRKDFPAEKEATDWEQQVKEQLSSGRAVSPAVASSNGSCTTLKQLLDKVTAMKWKGTKNEDHAVRNAEAVVTVLGESCPLSRIAEQQVDELIEAFRAAGNSGSTINRKLASLSKMLRFAHHRGYIMRMPRIERMKESEHRIRWVTSDEEVRVLSRLEATGRVSERDLVILLIDSGMRLSEALRLTYADCDGQWMRVWETKSGSPRSVPMTERVEKMILTRKQLHADHERVFEDINIWSAETAWKDVRKHMKLEKDPQFVLHCLRHTFCSRLAQRGTQLQVIQKLAGHKTISMTLRYSHLIPDNLMDVIRGNIKGLSPTESLAS